LVVAKFRCCLLTCVVCKPFEQGGVKEGELYKGIADKASSIGSKVGLGKSTAGGAAAVATPLADVASAGTAAAAAIPVADLVGAAAALKDTEVILAELVPVSLTASAAMTGVSAAATTEAVAISGVGAAATITTVAKSVLATVTGACSAVFASLTTAAAAVSGSLTMTGAISAALSGAFVIMSTAASVATAAMASLFTILAPLVAPIAAIAAVIAAVLIPVLAALDDSLDGTLSKSGMYPSILKKIGDAMNFFTPIGAIIDTVVFAFRQLWTIIKMVGEAVVSLLLPVLIPLGAVLAAITVTFKATQLVISGLLAAMRAWLYVALIPIKVALFALAIPLKLLKLAFDAIFLPFTLAKKASEYFVAAIKLIPSAASAAWAGIQKLSAWAWSAAKMVGSAAVSIVKSIGAMVQTAGRATVALGKMAWAGMVGGVRLVGDAINGVGAALKQTGMAMGIVGGGLAALGASIVGPLTQAASMFQEHGETVSRLAKGYKISAEAASVYTDTMGQMNRAVGEKGGAAGGFRMQENRMASLVKTMKEGSAEYEKWRKQAEASGMVLGGPGVESALAMDDAMDRLRDSLKGLWIQLGSAVAPAVVEATEFMAGFVRGVVTWVKENKPLVASVFQVAKVVAGVGTAIGIAGTALITLGSAISPLTAVLAAIAGAMAVVEYRTGAARSLWDAYKGSVVSVYNTVVQTLGPVVAFVRETLDGIYDAVKAGDLALAAQIAWGGFKIAWIDGLLWLSERTSGTFQAILQNHAVGNWKAAADGAMGMVQAAFLRMQDVADRAWTWVINKADETWNWVQNGAERMWVGIQDAFSIGLVAVEASWVEMLNNMKIWASEFLVWLRQNMIEPLVSWMENSNLVPDSWAKNARKAVGSFKDMEGALQRSTLSEEDKAKKISGIQKTADDERDARHRDLIASQDARESGLTERQAGRLGEQGDRSRQRNDEIARQQSRGGAGEGVAFEAELKSRTAREKLEADKAEAKRKMEEMAQPDEPGLAGKEKEGKGMVVSGAGAYAAMMIGSADSPAKQTNNLLKQTRIDQLKHQNAEKQHWKEMIALLKQLGADTSKYYIDGKPVWDMMG